MFFNLFSKFHWTCSTLFAIQGFLFSFMQEKVFQGVNIFISLFFGGWGVICMGSLRQSCLYLHSKLCITKCKSREIAVVDVTKINISAMINSLPCHSK